MAADPGKPDGMLFQKRGKHRLILGRLHCAELFKREKAPEGVNPRDIAVKRLKKNVPHLLKAHKPEMIAIMAAIEGISAAEYEAKLNLVNFIKDFTELLTDDAFIALFTSAQSGKPSGSAPVTSKAKA